MTRIETCNFIFLQKKLKMDFAEKQLLKYGWKKGQGLGINQDGINRPITVGVKQDNQGIGVDQKGNSTFQVIEW